MIVDPITRVLAADEEAVEDLDDGPVKKLVKRIRNHHEEGESSADGA